MDEPDAAVWAALLDAGFTGPVWDRVGASLAVLGYRYFTAWTATGEVFDKCREKRAPGLTGTHHLAHFSPADREELVQDVVAHGIDLLRRHGRDGTGWRPDGGATLRTYYISTCLLVFPTVYRGHCRRRARRHGEHLVADLPEPDGRAGAGLAAAGLDVAERVAARIDSQRRLQTVRSPLLRRVLALKGAGHSYPEIAATVGLTRRQVERLVTEWRRQHETSEE